MKSTHCIYAANGEEQSVMYNRQFLYSKLVYALVRTDTLMKVIWLDDKQIFINVYDTI